MSAILTPGAPTGSRSIHFTSAAGTKTGADPCAKATDARTNDAANTRMPLSLMKAPPYVFENRCARLSPLLRRLLHQRQRLGIVLVRVGVRLGGRRTHPRPRRDQLFEPRIPRDDAHRQRRQSRPVLCVELG